MKILQKSLFTISAMALAFSVLFTMLHLEGLRELYAITVGAFFLGSAVDYRNLRNFIGLVCGLLLLAGLFFKMQHLQGANILLMVGILVLAFAYIPVAIWRKSAS